MIDQHFIDTLKQADWYFDFCEGLQEWSKGRKSYFAAVYILKNMTEDVRLDLMKQYVPEQLHERVLKDIGGHDE